MLRGIRKFEEPVPVTNVETFSLLSHVTFQILKSNDTLRTALKEFLEAEIAFVHALSFPPRIKFIRFRKPKERQEYEDQLKVLEATRNEAFKRYDLLRRLTDWDNPLLKRIPVKRS